MSIKVFKIRIERAIEVVFKHEVCPIAGIVVEHQTRKVEQPQVGKRNVPVVFNVGPHPIQQRF